MPFVILVSAGNSNQFAPKQPVVAPGCFGGAGRILELSFGPKMMAQGGHRV